MSLFDLLLTLKGSYRSGNFDHAGRPGKHGGSSPGGGHGKIGISSDTPKVIADQILGQKREPKKTKPIKEERDYKPITEKEFLSSYDYKKICGTGKKCGAVTTYTSEAFEDINGLLRGTRTPKDQKSIEKLTKEMDSIIDKAPPIPKDMISKRFIDKSFFDKLEQGTEFQDKGFVSTTIHTTKTKGLSDIQGDYEIEIRIPKGSKGMYLDGKSEYPEEKELLLPRGSNFRIVSKEGKKIVAELI